MQEVTTEVKAEMRAVLQHYGITQFKIRPVRRNYAFEQVGVTHAMQWVLKVTYPASMPQLPLGLSGEAGISTGATASRTMALEHDDVSRIRDCWHKHRVNARHYCHYKQNNGT